MKRKDFMRAGALSGLLGLCAVLASRKEKFKCAGACGKCPEFEGGECRRSFQLRLAEQHALNEPNGAGTSVYEK